MEAKYVHTQTAHKSLKKLAHTLALVFPHASAHVLVILFHSVLLRPRTLVALKTSGTSAYFLCGVFISTALRSSPALLPVGDATMERSAKELFLNFMIVLITVLLMWLLVKTYQD